MAEKPSRLWRSYRFTLHNVLSLWKGETELGLLTAGNTGLVQAQSWLMMAAVHVMSIRAEKEKEREQGVGGRGGGQDGHGTCETPPASFTPVQNLC